MLGALALTLGYLETFVPLPLPGVKLGLANVAVLVALATGDLAGACGVAVIKVLASAFLFGSPVTLAYSAVGTALSLVAMVPLSRLATMRLTMVSVVGALLHETGQLLVAQALLGTSYVWLAAPPLLVAAVVTGALCGGVATATVRALHAPDARADAWAAKLWREARSAHVVDERRPPSHVEARVALVAFVGLVAVILHAHGIVLAGTVALGIVGCLVTRVSVNQARRAARPVIALVLATLLVQTLLAPGGSAVVTLGPVVVGSEALATTALLATRLMGVTAAGLAFARATTIDDLVAAIAWAMTPLSACGVRVAGLALALGVTLRMGPQLVEALDIRARTKDGLPEGLSWRQAVPAFVAATYRQVDAVASDRTVDG